MPVLPGGKDHMGDRRYQIDTEENRKFLAEQAESLIAFGKNFPSPAGSSYWLGDDGQPWKDRDRETWITSRMVHVYSLGTMLGFDWCRELAEKGVHGLLTELHDQEHGGWYAGVHKDGTPFGTKQCYAHAFVILASLSATLAKVPEAEGLLQLAEETYDRYFWDQQAGLSRDTWSMDFKELDPYRGINANMHSVEAFLADADITGKELYRKRAGNIIRHVIAWAEENDWRIPEHYTSDWQPDLFCNQDKPDDQFKPYGATPGHGIEWARLITQWALSTYPGEEEKAGPFIEAAENLYHRAVMDGWNADGEPGIVYTTDWNGKPVVHDRMHWTLAEAINTSSCLYHATGRGQYAMDYVYFLTYLDDKVIDHVYGSWFHQLDRRNQVLGTVWPGKSDLYHATQAMLIPYYDPGVSIAKAVSGGSRYKI